MDSSQFSAVSHRTRLPIALSPNSKVFSAESLWARPQVLYHNTAWDNRTHCFNNPLCCLECVTLNAED